MEEEPTDHLPTSDQLKFGSSNFEEGRLLWHDAVHRREQEECSFFLIKLSEPQRLTRAKLIQDALESAGIESFCLYGLFGYYDFLLRVWCRPEWRSRLIDEFEERRERLAVLRELRVSTVDYWMQAPPPTDRDVVDAKEAIDILTRADSSGGIFLDHEAEAIARELLSKKRVLFFVPPIEPPDFKFYVALSVTGTDRNGATGLDGGQVRQVLAEVPELTHLTIYTGHGSIGTMLLKAVAPSVYVLGRVSETLKEWGGTRGLTTETILIDPSAVSENDTIEAILHAGESYAVARLMNAGRGRFDRLAANLSRPELDFVARAFDDVEGQLLVDSDIRNLGFGLIEAAMANDPWTLTAAMSYVQELEGRFRALLIQRMLPGRFGADWFTSDTRHALESALEAPALERPSDWTLKWCVSVARAAGQIDPQFQADLVTQLGSDALSTLDKLVPYRNQVAHGKLFQPALPSSVRLAIGENGVLDLRVLLQSLVLLLQIRQTDL